MALCFCLVQTVITFCINSSLACSWFPCLYPHAPSSLFSIQQPEWSPENLVRWYHSSHHLQNSSWIPYKAYHVVWSFNASTLYPGCDHSFPGLCPCFTAPERILLCHDHFFCLDLSSSSCSHASLPLVLQVSLNANSAVRSSLPFLSKAIFLLPAPWYYLSFPTSFFFLAVTKKSINVLIYLQSFLPSIA